VVTEAIDRQTTRVRKSVSEAWDASGATEHTYALRSYLSSVSAIEGIIMLLELYCLANELIPFKFLTTFPAISAIGTRAFPIKVPDLFVLLSSAFWAPFSVWLTSSLILPSVFAYFFNLSYKTSQQQGGHTYGTRRAAVTQQTASARSNLDPLVFHVSKALVSYLVYANHFTFWNAFSLPAILRVSGAVPGGLTGLLTGSAVCTLGSLYEAILRK
jgi:membrane protein implicated in regulation of membrane protease activity